MQRSETEPQSDFAAAATLLRRLQDDLATLADEAETLGVPQPGGHEWYELLTKKLLPQCEGDPWLVVAVVGGTNIGKSVIFNHLAGEQASAVSPLAAGTKHPVCLVSGDRADEELLAELFADFELTRWQAAEDPLRDSPEDHIYWRSSETIPARLLVLDTPDIDSDAQVNWQRADAIRQAADVLVAVLTQQKYNDAAVKRFFRKAAAADKPVIVVFNQVDLKEDREYWPAWLATFVDQTGARPELAYVIPYDRAAAGSLELPFYFVGRDGHASFEKPSRLQDELAALRFDAIKLRTLRGALRRVLDAGQGAPHYLDRLRAASEDFAAAHRVLESARAAQVTWPSLPPQVLVEEITEWWDAHRGVWSRRVHGAYRTLWNGATWPVRKSWEALRTPQEDPLVAFRRAEREAIARTVERLLDELSRLAEGGNETLRPRLERILAGDARQRLLQRVAERHDALPAMEEGFRAYLSEELDRWVEEHPRYASWLRTADQASAVMRPAISVSLFFGGMMMIDGVAAQAATHAATQLATEVTIAGGISGGGDAVVAASGSGMLRAAARLLLNLQRRYAQSRVEWFYELLQEELLGEVTGELEQGAVLPQSSAFAQVEQTLDELSRYA